jgi:hypothetical protein
MGDFYLEDDDDTNKFRVTFEHLVASSCDPAQSRDRIRRTVQELWS